MKLYKATVSFAGKVCMAVNEERRLADEDAAGLLKAGYIKPVKEEQPEEQQNSINAETAETVTETAETVTETAKQSKSKKK